MDIFPFSEGKEHVFYFHTFLLQLGLGHWAGEVARVGTGSWAKSGWGVCCPNRIERWIYIGLTPLISAEHFGSNFVGMWGIIFFSKSPALDYRGDGIATKNMASREACWPNFYPPTLRKQLLRNSTTDGLCFTCAVDYLKATQTKLMHHTSCKIYNCVVLDFTFYFVCQPWLRWWHTICTGGVYQMSTGIVHNMQLARASNNFTAGYGRMDPSTSSAFKSAMM